MRREGESAFQTQINVWKHWQPSYRSIQTRALSDSGSTLASAVELGYICLYPFSNGKFNPHLRKEGTLGKTGTEVEVAPFLLRGLFGGFQTNCQTHSSPFRCGNGGERAEGSCGHNKSVRESLHTFRQSKNSDG